MRQRLPDDAGYPLHSPEVGEIWPGREFEAPALVPGCVSLDTPSGEPPAEVTPDSAEPAQETPASPPVADDPGEPATDGTGPQEAPEDTPPVKDTSRAPARKPARTKEPKR